MTDYKESYLISPFAIVVFVLAGQVMVSIATLPFNSLMPLTESLTIFLQVAYVLALITMFAIQLLLCLICIPPLQQPGV